MTGRGRIARAMRAGGLGALGLLVPGACGGGPPAATPSGDGSIRFVVRVAETAPGSRWAVVSDREGTPGWVTLEGPDGAEVALQPLCAVPDCGQPPAVCGQAMPEARELAPGDSLSLTWDGRVSRVDASEGCERRVPAPAGTYVAEICVGDGLEAPTAPADPTASPALTGLHCQTREVEVPGPATVEIRVR